MENASNFGHLQSEPRRFVTGGLISAQSYILYASHPQFWSTLQEEVIDTLNCINTHHRGLFNHCSLEKLRKNHKIFVCTNPENVVSG